MSIMLYAIDSLNSALLVIDRKGIILEVNKGVCDLFDYKNEELIGSNIECLIPSYLCKVNRENLKKSSTNHKLEKPEKRRILIGKRKNQSEFYIEFNLVFFEYKRELFGIANILDVTSEYRERKLLDRTQEVAKIGSWQVDLKKNKCHWSKMTYHIHELEENKEVLLEDGINFYSVEHRPIIRDCVEQGIKNGKTWNVELKILTTKGEEKWVRAIGSPVVENGNTIGLEGTFQDIHKEKMQRIANEDLLKKLKKTEDLASIGHWEWKLDPEKTQWSKGLYKIWELDPKITPPSIEDYEKWIHEEDKALFYKTINHGLSNKIKFNLTFRAYINKKLKYIRWEGEPIFEKAKLISFFGTVQDVTSQIKTENKVRSLNHRLTLALDASQVGIWEWNLTTNELIWDEHMYNLYGIKEEDFEGAYFAWEKGLYLDDKEKSIDLLKRASRGEIKFDTEFRVKWPNGAIRYIRALANLNYDNNGKAHKMIGVNWDITNIKNYEKRLIDINKSLERANHELAQFSYRSSHDLKAPLISIRELTKTIIEDIDDNDLDEAKKMPKLSLIKQKA